MSDIRKTYAVVNRNLVGLSVFTVVAQHGNLTRAADILGISQSAMSQRIKNLEADLGLILFKREQRGVALTGDGLQLFQTMQPLMGQVNEAISSMIERKTKPRVRLSTDFAFSTFWLLPRLPFLRDEMDGEIDIQILTSQTPVSAAKSDCDLIVHMGSIKDMKDSDVLLLRERTIAVCSPSYLEKHGPFSSPDDLLGQQLLSLSRPPTALWHTWQSWFDGLGINGERTRDFTSFDNSHLVVQAAIAGQGVALGWLGLVDDTIKTGHLVQATDDIVSSEHGYVMSRTEGALTGAPKRVFDWIDQSIG